MGGKLSRWVTIFPCLVAISSCASGDIKYLTCYETLQSQVFERPSNFMSGGSSGYITNLPGLVAIYHVVVEI